MTIRAVVVDRDAPLNMRSRDLAEPSAKPNQVVIDVHHVSVNLGDLQGAAIFPAGTVLGWDASGVIVQPTADGTGPPVGARVVALGAGAWAEKMVTSVDNLAVVPDRIGLAEAAALPTAACTALRTLRAGGSLLGRRVLITGAAGGVGRYAVQLAALSGAHVIASVGSDERGKGLAELGAHQVVTGLEGVSEGIHLVLDTVGGPQLVAAFALLGPGGSVQSIGWASGEAAEFPPYSTFFPGRSKSLATFGDAERVGADLATLLDLLADGRLSAEVGWRGSWERVTEAVEALASRQVAGKAVLDVRPVASDPT